MQQVSRTPKPEERTTKAPCSPPPPFTRPARTHPPGGLRNGRTPQEVNVIRKPLRKYVLTLLASLRIRRGAERVLSCFSPPEFKGIRWLQGLGLRVLDTIPTLSWGCKHGGHDGINGGLCPTNNGLSPPAQHAEAVDRHVTPSH